RLFGYFCVFTKVTRCKSGTISRRYRRNGYAPNKHHHRVLNRPQKNAGKKKPAGERAEGRLLKNEPADYRCQAHLSQ
ncbi:hypothetical protein, partial [Pseudomonas fluorescens]